MERSVLFIDSPKLTSILRSVFEFDNFTVNVQAEFPDQNTIKLVDCFVFHDISWQDEENIIALHQQGKPIMVLSRTFASDEMKDMYENFKKAGIRVEDKGILFEIVKFQNAVRDLISQVKPVSQARE